MMHEKFINASTMLRGKRTAMHTLIPFPDKNYKDNNNNNNNNNKLLLKKQIKWLRINK